MFSKKRKFGNKGEDIACKYLKKNGYTIIQRNFLTKLGEIDIVAKRDDRIFFIEVKSGNSNSLIDPAENMTSKKMSKLTRTIEYYLIKNPLKPGLNYQIDLISITMNEETKLARVTHIKNIS